MFRSLMLQALVVLGLSSAGLLLTSERAEGAYYGCDEWNTGPCNGWDEEDANIACHASGCPGWVMLLCDPDTGKYMCISNPT
jgi:hypothetical protein